MLGNDGGGENVRKLGECGMRAVGEWHEWRGRGRILECLDKVDDCCLGKVKG